MDTVGERIRKAQESGDLDGIKVALLDAKAAGADPAEIETALQEVTRLQEAKAKADAAGQDGYGYSRAMAGTTAAAGSAGQATPSAGPGAPSPAVVADAEADIAAAAAASRSQAEAHKKRGNDALKGGTKSAAKDAVECYTTGLEVRCSDSVLNAQLYSNRAHARILLQQFVEAVDDCRKAIEHDPKNMKAYWRAAKASLHLDLFDQGIVFCDAGLKRAPTDADLLRLKSACSEKLAQRQKRRAEMASNPAAGEFNADEAMGVQEKVNEMNEQIQQLRMTMQQKQREAAKNQAVRNQLLDLPVETKAYVSVGRCFIKQELNHVDEDVGANLQRLAEELPRLEKTLQEMEKRKEGYEQELKEMVEAFKRQTDQGAGSASA